MIKLFRQKWSFLFKFRLLLGLILLIITLVFLYLKIVPFGHITYSRDYSSHLNSGKGFIYGFTPVERVDLKSGSQPRLIGDPIYFSLFTPRTFDKAKVTVTYRDFLGIDTPVVEMGVLADNVVWRYELKPLDNKALDYLMLKWNKTEENGKIFLQKEKNYSSLSSWENDLARGQLKGCVNELENCLAVYNYSPKYTYQISNYQSATPVSITVPLRGVHQFYVYVQNEPLRLSFNLVDLNQSKKPSPINIILSSADKVIDSKTINDDNPNPGSGITEEKNVVIDQPKLAAGVYKVEVKITDDMVIKRIESSVNRLSFINKVWPVSNPGSVKLYTDTDYLQVKAVDPASLQTISFGGQNFTLTEAYRQFNFNTQAIGKTKEIDISKDNLILENNGMFAFVPSSLFNPSLPKVDNFFSVKTPLKYIVADYQKPIEEEGFKTATAELNLKGAYRENGKYSFMISVPGLKTEDGIDDYLEIYQIKIELDGRTIWQKIWQ